MCKKQKKILKLALKTNRLLVKMRKQFAGCSNLIYVEKIEDAIELVNETKEIFRKCRL